MVVCRSEQVECDGDSFPCTGWPARMAARYAICVLAGSQRPLTEIAVCRVT